MPKVVRRWMSKRKVRQCQSDLKFLRETVACQPGGTIMVQQTSLERLYTTVEFDRWWEAQGRATALRNLPDPAAAKSLAWEAWRKGREHLSEATASHRLQPARR
jgi:hypothetical protein